MSVQITRRDGSHFNCQVLCRIDTDEELETYLAGGVLQRFANDLLNETR